MRRQLGWLKLVGDVQSFEEGDMVMVYLLLEQFCMETYGKLKDRKYGLYMVT